jgi:hypothetical protein
MGAMKFKQKGREEQAEPDGTEAGLLLAKLLGIDGEELYKNICKVNYQSKTLLICIILTIYINSSQELKSALNS